MKQENNKKFPNGFNSWQETHYEIVSFIQAELRKNFPSGLIGRRYEEQGTGGIYELSEELTDKFEQMNKDRNWDGDFFDSIEEFMKKETE